MPDVPWVRRKKGGASMSKKKSSLAGLQALVCARVRNGRAQKLIVACVRILDSKDGTVQSTLRKFGTMTADLIELRQWLTEHGVTHVAMESTGIYWQPVFNLLEGHFTLLVINAQHHQESAWAKDRHEGRGVDRAAVAVWAFEAEFCSRPPATRAARSDASTD